MSGVKKVATFDSKILSMISKENHIFILTEKSYYKINDKMEIVEQISVEEVK